jgi:hypothetical protein
VPKTLRQFLAVLLSLTFVRAATPVELGGLTGRWTNEAGRSFRLTETEALLELELPDGPIGPYLGIPGRETMLYFYYPALDVVPQEISRNRRRIVLPEQARRQLLEFPFKIELETLEPGKRIRLTYTGPTYDPTTGEMGETEPRSTEFTKASKPFCPEILLEGVLADAERSELRLIEATRPPSSLRAREPGETEAELAEQYLQWHPAALGGVKVDYTVAGACRDRLEEKFPRRVDELDLTLTAEFYWAKRALYDGVNAALNQIVAYEAVERLEVAGRHRGHSRNPGWLRNVVCSDYTLVPDSYCPVLKACPLEVDFRNVLAQTEHVGRQYQVLREELRFLQEVEETIVRQGTRIAFLGLDELRERTGGTQAGLRREIAHRRQQIAFVEALAPVVSPRRFEPVVDHNNVFRLEQAGGAMRAEALEQREAIERRLEGFMQAIRCLEPEEDCALDAEAFRDVLNRVPPLPHLTAPDRFTAQGARQASYVSGLLATAQNRSQLRMLEDQAAEIRFDLAKGIAITILTAGMGSAASLIRAGRVIVLTSRGAVVAHRAAMALEAAALAIEGIELAVDLTRTVRQCNEAFRLGEGSQAAPAPSPQCPLGDSAPGQAQAASYTGCLLEGVSLDLFGAIAGGVQALSLFRSSRFLAKALEAAPNASARQMQVIREVFGGRARRLTRARFDEAVQKLKDVGLLPQEIEQLFRRFSSTPVYLAGDAVLGGIPGDVISHRRITLGGKPHTLVVRDFAGRRSMMLCSPCAPLFETVERLIRYGELSAADRRALSDLLDDLRLFEEPDPRTLRSAADNLLASNQAAFDQRIKEFGERLDRELSESGRRVLLDPPTELRRPARTPGLRERQSQHESFDLLAQTDDLSLNFDGQRLHVEEPYFTLEGDYVGFGLGDLGDLFPPGSPRRAARPSDPPLSLDEIRTLARDRLGANISVDPRHIDPSHWRARGRTRSEAEKLATAARNEFRRQLFEAMRGKVTQPDYAALRGGGIVGLELKTPQGDTTFDFFVSELRRRPTVADEGDHLLRQMSDRAQLPSNELILDIRGTGETVEAAIRGLQQVRQYAQGVRVPDALKDLPWGEYLKLAEVYPTVRFMHVVDGELRLTRAFPMPGRQ